MISINKHTDCCGCGSCEQACPKNCIKLVFDEEGFLYPQLDTNSCIDCGLCEKVCPMQTDKAAINPLRVCAYKNQDEKLRMDSSSGGLFIALTKVVLSKGGVVFGVSYDENWMPVHTYAEDVDGVKAFMGSKYVQSRTGNSYQKAKEFLQSGRMVLYSGTPCQIAGLKSFLHKEYEHLLTIEVMCHGVPSPGVWRQYINDICPKGIGGQNTVSPSLNELPSIEGISFRDKSEGWSKFGFVVYGKSASKADQNSVLSSNNIMVKQWSKQNPYMQAFLSNVILRPTCYSCRHKNGRSGADLSLGDFWSIGKYRPELNDNKGISLVYALTAKGKELLDSIGNGLVEFPVGEAYNTAFITSAKEKYPREKFWARYNNEGLSCMAQIYQSTKPGFWKRMKIRISNRLHLK